MHTPSYAPRRFPDPGRMASTVEGCTISQGGCILWLLGGAGLRVSEVAALKVEHIDGTGGYLHVVNGKGGKQRTSILPQPALVALETYLDGRGEGYMSSKGAIAVIYRLGRSRDC
jgi:site-specific recombinase XerD